MIEIYDLGKKFNFSISNKEQEEKLKFIDFPYTYSEIISTSAILFFAFLFLGLLANFLFEVEILFITAIFVGLITATISYIYPTQIFYLTKIIEYKKEMLNSIMRFSTYLSMNSNLEYALMNSKEYTKGILRKQFETILIKLERKEFIDLGEAFKYYSLIWNQYSPEFVDSLKLLEVASLASGYESEQILEEAISQIILSYHIEQKRSTEELSEKIQKIIMAGIMLPVMFLMMVPLISVFLPDIIKASALFFLFNILIPSFLLVSSLNFAARRLQFSSINIEESKKFQKIPRKIYILVFILFCLISFPGFFYLIINPPGNISYDSFDLVSIFFTWLIPLAITISIFILSFYYYKKNKILWLQAKEIEEDLPHLLNYFSTYLVLNVPMENIFEEIVTDYKRHGFEKHPSVGILNEIFQKLINTKTNLNSFIKYKLREVSQINSLNEVLEQINAFAEVSLKEASRVSKKIRSQRVGLIKLNDYILTLLNNSISLIGSTISMLTPLLSSLAIVMSLFIITFIEYLTAQLEVVANLGITGGARVEISLIDITQIISPIYLQLIISFYLIEIILILSFLKASIKYGTDNLTVVKSVLEGQIGFFVFTLCLFGGYFLFKSLFSSALGVDF